MTKEERERGDEKVKNVQYVHTVRKIVRVSYPS